MFSGSNSLYLLGSWCHPDSVVNLAKLLDWVGDCLENTSSLSKDYHPCLPHSKS